MNNIRITAESADETDFTQFFFYIIIEYLIAFLFKIFA